METMMRRLLLPIIHPLPCSWLDLMLLNVDVSAPVPVRSAYKLTPLHLAPITFLYMLTIQHPPTPPLTIPPVCSSFVAFCSGHHSTSVRPSISQSVTWATSESCSTTTSAPAAHPTDHTEQFNEQQVQRVCVRCSWNAESWTRSTQRRWKRHGIISFREEKEIKTSLEIPFL